ncbi:hypothetical protein [Blastococcus haudaquaticus]|uniref:Uncharacterized protein n=1 Tax=Blastococcus haudaquaticus TaxID=1938745 RepID=A0A286H680_9ACTN|nr:hypothetical protein [Blastococcus haudaquaticus]SOE03277.1 hypothetical protein SAMN06272739_4073 [Blastococcus haudaquaticus]
MRRALPALLAALGGVLVGSGITVFWLANTWRWTAYDGSYAPAEPGSAYESRLTLGFDGPWTVLWTGGHLAGALLVVAGLLVLAATGGWWLGRRGGLRRGSPAG